MHHARYCTQPDAARLPSADLTPGQLSLSSSHSHVMSSTAKWANSQGAAGTALAVHTGNSTPACHHAHRPHVTMPMHLDQLVREATAISMLGAAPAHTSCVLVRPAWYHHCGRPVSGSPAQAMHAGAPSAAALPADSVATHCLWPCVYRELCSWSAMSLRLRAASAGRTALCS